MKTFYLPFLLLMALRLGVVAHADRDIVYAARYYTPPGSHRTSHFHLYRINPDGTGKTQLTFGTADDWNPQWSPEGKWIVFMRQSEDGRSSLCLIHAAGDSVQTLLPPGLAGTYDTFDCRWSPDGRTLAVVHTVNAKNYSVSVSLINVRSRQIRRRFLGASDFFWSPDVHRAYLVADAGDKLLDLKSGASIAVQEKMENPVWLNDQALLGQATDPKTERYFLRLMGLNGREKQRLPLRFPTHYAGAGTDDDPAMSLGSLTRRPVLVYGINEHNSTVGVDWAFFRLQLSANSMHYLTEGQFLAWSPDGSHFCTAPGRDTTPYEKRRYPYDVERGTSADDRVVAHYRLVWFAPLYVRATHGGPMRQLTPRLSYVTGADWRRAPKPALQRSR